MKAITYEYASQNFDEMFSIPDIQTDGLIIVKDKQNYVLIDKDLLDSLYETIELTKDKDFVSSIS